jgi:sigma-B regulation protein RsbU (phosphoserine phosphatase)
MTSDPQKTDDSLSDTMFIRKRKAMGVGVQPLLNAILTTNQYIARNHGSANMFATVFFGILNPQDGKLIYVNAGHEPPMLLHRDGTISRLDATGPVVGMFEESIFEVGESEIKHGELLFTYTDGVTDARNKTDAEFSEERLFSLLEMQKDTPQAALKNIMAQVHAHIANHDQYDDLTALSILRKNI